MQKNEFDNDNDVEIEIETVPKTITEEQQQQINIDAKVDELYQVQKNTLIDFIQKNMYTQQEMEYMIKSVAGIECRRCNNCGCYFPTKDYIQKSSKCSKCRKVIRNKQNHKYYLKAKLSK